MGSFFLAETANTFETGSISDTITIKAPVRRDALIQFYNGYQSEKKPYLYKQNSRAKRLSVRYVEVGKTVEFNLADSPEKQSFAWNKYFGDDGEVATLEITILEVYPGSKYKDLCIQAIVPEIDAELECVFRN